MASEERHNRLSLEVEGAPEDNGDVRLDDLIRELDAFRDALTATDRLITGGGPSVYYRVVNLTHNSPATVVVEAVPLRNDVPVQRPEDVLTAFRDSFDRIISGRLPELDFEPDTFEKFRRLSPRKTSIARVRILQNGYTSVVPDNFIERVMQVESAGNRYHYEYGSVSGDLQAFNTHGRRAIFTVYPPVREERVRCLVSEDLRAQFLAAADKYITVYGRLKFRQGERHPDEMRADKIVVHKDAPTFQSLKGIAQDGSGELSSADFVRGLRNEWP